MKKSTHLFVRLVSVLLIAAMALPDSVLASATATAVAAPAILITEMSPGTAVSGSQEFIELYNQSTQSINLSGEQWQVQIASSKATTWDGAKTVALSGTFYPGTYLLLSSNYTVTGDTQSYLQQYASAQFSSGLTATSGHIRLVHTVNAVITEVDRLEWSTTANGTYTSSGIGGASVFALDSAIDAGSSIKRKTDANHTFMTTADVALNFAVSPCPSPTANNTASITPLPTTSTSPLPTTVDIANPLCAATSSDPNQESEIPVSSTEPPAVLLPAETIVSTPTATTPTIPAADAGLSAPQITELLPNPGSPRTDATDEFVELYNPNAVAFDLSGFVLTAGLTGNKQYTFPAGTTIPAHAFVAYFSETTKLSLSNTSGKVILQDPLQRTIAQSGVYDTAKDDVAWARANGKWYWTTQVTPNAANVIQEPVAKTKKSSSSSSSSKKTSTVAKTASSKKSASAADTQLTSNTVEDTPLHPLTLAVVGGFALLYGAYEYRRDMANKFYQLRRYREARREARRLSKGG
ncbi:MAG TPA: lamin tail domain-containing protein [Candidatus Saccharimonadales bacterium]|nr:lamin tail domain-containing protein [Candidatus Saccharimonadales bacterium]